MNGGAGNDTLVWNQGDGSDRASGDGGNDVSEVNGAPTLGDVFILEPVVGGTVQLRRTNLGQFTFDAATERFEVDGLGGNDSFTAKDGVGALTLLSLDGGAGLDTINGSEEPDRILGGEADDTLTGGGGDDRILGDRGADIMNGGAGDDTLVWNNGDGTDVVNGDDGRDDVEVNGAPAAGDKFTAQPNGVRIELRPHEPGAVRDRHRLQRDAARQRPRRRRHDHGRRSRRAVPATASEGPGNDTLSGGGSSETFLGGSGADTINPGAGLDVVFGDDGDDQATSVTGRPTWPSAATGTTVVADAGQARPAGRLRVRRPHAERHASVHRHHRRGRLTIRGGHCEGEEGHSVDQLEPARPSRHSTAPVRSQSAPPSASSSLA